VVATVLLVAGWALVLLQSEALTASIDDALSVRADDVLSLDHRDLADYLTPGSVESFTQLVDVDGRVVASTPNLDGEPPLDFGLLDATDIVQTLEVPQVDDDLFRVLSRPHAGGVVHVGTTYDVVTESIAALVGTLALVIPILLITLAVLIYWLVGRTLKPVEDIVTEVSGIGSRELHRRVPRPGTEDEIDRLAATMNQMLERLQISVERQQRFVGDASHELRTPLTRLRTELELGLATAEGPAERGRLQSLLSEVIATEEMVGDLLYLSRTEASEPLSARVDLDDLVIAEGRRLTANGRVQVNLAGVSGAQVMGDRGQLERAIRNLVDNAERHANTQVAVTLCETNGDAVLTVADDGPGIPVEGAGRIFDRFARLDEARSAGSGGTGLGLAIASEIAMRHRGSLSLTNPGEPGASFELRLPVAD
jgi:signal transduction histidine kinase